jgi:hypothetical protein
VAEKLEELRDIKAEALQAWEESLGHVAEELIDIVDPEIWFFRKFGESEA